MLRKRYYILFVARDEDGRVRKISLPVQYVYGFVAAALVGAFTIVGLAGSYTRMLLKTESFNQIRQERETLRKNYQQMAEVAHERDVQVASLGALASEVTAIYGLKQNLPLGKHSTAVAASSATPTTLATTDDVNQQQVKLSLDQFYTLRAQALSGRVSRALEGGFGADASSGLSDWTQVADAPSLWPVEGRVTSTFGERQDPFNGEGAFHAGLDISAPTGTVVRATGDGQVDSAEAVNGYGHEVIVDHGHGVRTVYAHLSGMIVIPGQHVARGQIIGYVGQTGRSTGPHLHYEVRINNVPVNPHKYLRSTFAEMEANNLPASAPASASVIQGK
ncbi:M23 family metallopeptidase [Acidicapsa ligni]|uniref:M23 family metallopeptidase n=1 Tax=Acidicapsa ligni TaxID=542300 RepID=UPI0021E02B89|nr:M23 family metallopeptidase [Acidicapsa ligni]